MERYQKLQKILDGPVEKFKKIDKFRIVSHYDADGISSAAIMLASSLRQGKNVQLSVVKQVRPDLIEKLNETNEENFVFTDLGSGHLEEMNRLEAENLIVLDHHRISGELEGGDLVNPHLVGFGEDSLSGAGVTYLFARELSGDNRDLAHLAVVGAIGDIQEENWRMGGLNEKILEEAVESGLLKKEEGLRLFGRLSRPLHKALEYTTSPLIPGVSENESGAVQFLSELDIDPKTEDGEWMRLKDLEQDDRKKLASTIIQKRITEGIKNPEEVFGDVYTLRSFDGDFRDARELSTALNASGRMSKPEVGILACLDDPVAKENLGDVVEGYKKLIGKYMSKARENDIVHHRENLVLVDGVGEIHENFIGTVISILQSSVSGDKPILGLASSEKDELKVSMRAPDDSEINVDELLQGAVERVGGEAGGHEKAGGGYIKEDTRESFIEAVEERLNH